MIIELSKLTNSSTDEDLEKEIRILEKQVNDLEGRIEELKQGKIEISETERKRIDQDYDKMRDYWKSRKKIFRSVWDTITEVLPGSPKEFMEELGIESDESVGLDFTRNPL